MWMCDLFNLHDQQNVDHQHDFSRNGSMVPSDEFYTLYRIWWSVNSSMPFGISNQYRSQFAALLLAVKASAYSVDIRSNCFLLCINQGIIHTPGTTISGKSLADLSRDPVSSCADDGVQQSH